MKTTEYGNKPPNYAAPRNKNQNLLENWTDPNEERIISPYQPKEKIYYYDNSTICMSYGQYNMERCLVVQFILIVYSAFLSYDYYLQINNLTFILLISTGGVDIIVTLLYIYFLNKLKSEKIFNRIPMFLSNLTDVVIMMNFVAKSILFVILCLQYFTIGLVAISLFAFKYLIEFYFAAISIKFLMFCPCSRFIQEQSEKLWAWIKLNVFCCDSELEKENDYSKIEDIESF